MPSSRKKSKTIKNNRVFSRREFLMFVFIFAAVGAITLIVSFAAPKTNTPGKISIATVNGSSYSSSTGLKLGDTVTFNTVAGSMAGWEYPMVDITCYQDVNGDGVINTQVLGPDIVYSWLDKPGATFSFSGQGQTSIWTLRGGGAATCRAELVAIGWKGGMESTRIMATTGDFSVSG